MRSVHKASFVVAFAVASILNAPSMALANSPIDAATSARPQCITTLYQFLPGDYNYCLASRHWLAGHYRRAEELLLLAAGWGSKPAQHLLGIAYFNGEGLRQDRAEGLAWLGLAAERKSQQYLAVFMSAHSQASASERRAADARYAELRRAYRDEIAATRAQRRYERQVNSVFGESVFQKRICMAGVTTKDLSSQMATVGFAWDHCPPAMLVAQRIQKVADHYFQGWNGRVVIGSPQTLQALP